MAKLHPSIAKRLVSLPADAWGFVMVRPDRPERRAFYDRTGFLHGSFEQGADDASIRERLATAGLTMADDGTLSGNPAC